MSRNEPLRHRLLRAVRWHRRSLAAVAAAAGVYLALTALAPAPPPTVRVLAAARDLPGGERLLPGDLRVVAIPPEFIPTGALRPETSAARRTLAAPIRAGEILTDARFVSPALVSSALVRRAGGAGVVAYPVRFDDAEVVALLRVGDRIDVYAATSTTSALAARLATGLRVMALPRAGPGAGPGAGSGAGSGETGIGSSLGGGGSTSGRSGALVVLELESQAAARIAQAATSSRLTLALSGIT
ncbi:SAF domain-containing protein [Kribbella sp. NBC_01245]|uniref:SAF domain-containing protein n=1 Tax=Kribbella sp. NBC_01245 TaxID=2903578 RepID=UPI002E293891|nr:SAF domain-containing protein [Kribbella sp. NBC_01245]